VTVVGATRARAAVAGCALAAMIATPLARRGGSARAVLASAVVAGAATTTTLAAAARWGGQRAAAAAGIVGMTTAWVERVGSTTGRPFGRYRYTGRLRPSVAEVPVVVPMAWWAMALPARETAHAALGRRTSAPARVLAGAAALTAWDLFLDPQMTTEGYWRWTRRGRYRGIPLSNYAGWLLVGAGVMAILEVALPSAAPDGPLVAEYAVMGVMESLGFLAFFRDPLVAAVGAAAMLPFAGAAVAALVGDG
jgi:putative membrane protein